MPGQGRGSPMPQPHYAQSPVSYKSPQGQDNARKRTNKVSEHLLSFSFDSPVVWISLLLLQGKPLLNNRTTEVNHREVSRKLKMNKVKSH